MVDVLVIGAGMSGLVCARQLMRAGLDVVVLEKSAGVGGRMATRRITPSPGEAAVIVDHGAQYLTTDTDALHRLLKEWLTLGLVVEWTRALHILDETGLHPDSVERHHPRYVCPAGMTAIAKYLADALTIHTQTKVVGIHLAPMGWQVTTEQGTRYTAANLVMALPAPQVLELLAELLTEASAAMKGLLDSATYLPCLAVMAGYPLTTPLPSWKGICCQGDEKLAWIALDSSKRPQPASPVVVLHASPEFSAQHLEKDTEQLQAVGSQLLKHAAQRLDPWLRTPVWMQVHRWRYALPEESVGMASLATRMSGGGSQTFPLICAGDWCGGGKIEGAWLSGHDAAEQLLYELGIHTIPSRFSPAGAS
ncbi:MAG: FAD-dependent oxidoreductase [Cyanobacteriota bacterium]|nr:FAD-dependent oxidoreductase [Cyanobacteriota bacterium]